jgi:hypothetical protein
MDNDLDVYRLLSRIRVDTGTTLIDDPTDEGQMARPLQVETPFTFHSPATLHARIPKTGNPPDPPTMGADGKLAGRRKTRRPAKKLPTGENAADRRKAADWKNC